MDRKRKIYLKYIGILVILCLPLFGILGIFLSRSLITPNDQFFVVSKGETPNISINTWNLSIEGHINNSLTYFYSNFTSLPSKEVLATIQCVDGPSGTALWKGVPMKDLIVALSGGKVDNTLVIDLCGKEDNYGDADIPMVFLPR